MNNNDPVGQDADTILYDNLLVPTRCARPSCFDVQDVFEFQKLLLGEEIPNGIYLGVTDLDGFMFFEKTGISLEDDEKSSAIQYDTAQWFQYTDVTLYPEPSSQKIESLTFKKSKEPISEIGAVDLIHFNHFEATGEDLIVNCAIKDLLRKILRSEAKSTFAVSVVEQEFMTGSSGKVSQERCMLFQKFCMDHLKMYNNTQRQYTMIRWKPLNYKGCDVHNHYDAGEMHEWHKKRYGLLEGKEDTPLSIMLQKDNDLGWIQGCKKVRGGKKEFVARTVLPMVSLEDGSVRIKLTRNVKRPSDYCLIQNCQLELDGSRDSNGKLMSPILYGSSNEPIKITVTKEYLEKQVKDQEKCYWLPCIFTFGQGGRQRRRLESILQQL